MPTRVALIMAGGAGERFWPLSRRNRPKQLLRLVGRQTMLEESVDRIVALTGYENLYIATGNDQAALVEKTLPNLPPANIIREPLGRDTAPCLALALAYMNRRGDDPTLAVITADHCIGRVERFHADCRAAFEHAESGDVLVTFGVQPTQPETGYGYIELGNQIAEHEGSQIFEVQRFREKPNLETARTFLEAGNFLWNSGMFVWRCSVLRRAMMNSAPYLVRASDEMATALGQPDESERLARIFERLPKISIDFAVMERARNVRCVRATFEWDDIGAWSALVRHHPTDAAGNVVLAKAVTLDTARSIIYSGDGAETEDTPLIATLGVEDLVVVVARDAILVCHRDHTQRIKEVVKKLREIYGDRYC
jgi:mannose-1-phosphate guanylyltransferase